MGDLAPSLLPDIALDGQARQLRLEELFRRPWSAPAASGQLDLDLEVTATGADLASITGSLSGQISATLRDGVLANRTINLAGQNTIAWVFTPTADGSAPLECLVARFNIAQGVGTAQELVFETNRVQVVGSGHVDLRDRTLDLVMVPRPKQNALIGKVGHVTITGPISEPQFSLARGEVAAKVLGDSIGLPLHLLGAIVGADGRLPAGHRPCVVVQAASVEQKPTTVPLSETHMAAALAAAPEKAVADAEKCAHGSGRMGERGAGSRVAKQGGGGQDQRPG